MRRIPAPLLLCAVASLVALVLAGCAAVSMPAVPSEPERLEVARRMVHNRDWTSAIELLKTYIDRNAGSARVDEAIYLLGECYLKTKDSPNAAVEFERIGRDFPESDSSAAASFGLGEALYGQSRPPDFDQDYTTKALDQWGRYRREYPGHWRVPEADQRVAKCRVQLASKLLNTAELYLKLRQTEPARVYFQRVEQTYDDTPLVGDARIGLFGGTFDPPHVGHLALAEWARQSLRLDCVLFVPAGRPPHKGRARLSAVEHRVAMTRLAVRDNPAFTVSALEARRDGPSFT